MELLLVSLASLLAGFVDAIVGGGGLILVPALFAIFPSTHPATLFGINKSASIWGTGIAAVQYSRRVQLSWRALLPAAGAGFAGSFAGAWAVTVLSPDFLRKLLPLVLLGVLAYTLAKKDMGRHHAPLLSGRAEALAAAGIGGVLGFYDGFFGPGTGTFLIVGFVVLCGRSLVHASADAKVVNFASNLAALMTFAYHGYIVWEVALPMAAGQLVGGIVGAQLAMKGGERIVRGVVLAVSGALIIKLVVDLI